MKAEFPTAATRLEGSTTRPQKEIRDFFTFICLSTAFRSFEAGIISSMMPDIRKALNIDYTQEGMLAASPDYGFVPGAALSIFVFQKFYWDARQVVAAVTFGTSAACLYAALYPSLHSLAAARAVSGLLWAHAAVHYPVWINYRGPAHCRTIWLASTNVSLLAGILAGYVVGGVARTSTVLYARVTVTWVDLYLLEGLLMMACGIILLSCFGSEVVDHRRDHQDGRQLMTHLQDNGSNTCELLTLLLCSVPFVLAVLITAVMSSAVVFALYFITQVSAARGLGEQETVAAVTMIMILAPAPGMLTGSWAVSRYAHQSPSHPAGGYTDHVATFQVALFSAVTVLLSALLFPLSWSIWGTEWKFPFVVACWGWFFFGGMTGPAMNGIAVSVVPRASHFASGLQFALANTAKIYLPIVGGYAIDQIGLVDGFNVTTVACTVVFLVLAVIGLLHAKQSEGYERLP